MGSVRIAVACVCCAVLALFVALAVDLTISANVFGRVHNQRPGRCKTYSKMNGSEDIVLLPNKHAIVTSGVQLKDKLIPNRGKLYVLNFMEPDPEPVPIKFEGSYLQNNPFFNPHGISYWVDRETGQIILYIVSHWENHEDSVESFQYNPESLSVKFLQSFRDPVLFFHLNNLVAVGRDEFYTTRWHYFANKMMLKIEQTLRLPWNSVVYYNGLTRQGKVVVEGLRSCNGINMSPNEKFIYVTNSLAGEIIAYTRDTKDNSLSVVDSVPVPIYVDNINVDPITGDIWAAVIVKCLEFAEYAHNTSRPLPSQTLHITVNQESDTPFAESKTEQVFQSDLNGAISSALYTNGTLVLGTVFSEMLICEVNYLMY